MTIQNRTPHPITILPAEGAADAPPALTLPAAGRGEVARVETTAHKVSTIRPDPRREARPDDPAVDVVGQRWGRVVGLAPEGPQVVSAIVAAALQAAGRDLSDVYVPADQVRDGAGRIVGCRGLLRAEDAVPRLGPPPQVVVFGSVLRDPVSARDIDVGYCGMDPATALRIARGWAARWLSVNHADRDKPIDLRYLPPATDDRPWIRVPRPGPLPGEGDRGPGLEGVEDVEVIFGTQAWRWHTCFGLAAVLRRAGRLVEMGTSPSQVAPMLAEALTRPDVLVLCEEPPPEALAGESYDAPTLGAVRRAWDRGASTLWPLVVEYASREAMVGPWWSLPVLLRATPEQVRHLAAQVCPPKACAASAPAWQRRAGRLLLARGCVSGEYGAQRVADPDVARVLATA